MHTNTPEKNYTLETQAATSVASLFLFHTSFLLFHASHVGF